MNIIQQIEMKCGFKIYQDYNLMWKLFAFDAAFINGCFLERNRHPNHLDEAILLTPRDTGVWSTLFHELAHATGAQGRLERTTLKDYMTDVFVQAMEEQIAERAAVILMEHFNLSTKASRIKSERYLKNYFIPSFQEDYVASEVKKAVDFILNNWVNNINFEPARKELPWMDKIRNYIRRNYGSKKIARV